jgi:hypothetical protein
MLQVKTTKQYKMKREIVNATIKAIQSLGNVQS